MNSGLSKSGIATVDHDRRRVRRGNLSPSSYTMERHVIWQSIEKFCNIFTSAYEARDVVNMGMPILALTTDIMRD